MTRNLFMQAEVWLAVTIVFGSTNAWAQGQDSTPGERNLLIMSELLPGTYSNANQALFDARRGLSDDTMHARKEFTITRLESTMGGRPAFSLVGDFGSDSVVYQMVMDIGPTPEEFSASLATGIDDEWRSIDDCSINFRRRAEHFDGRTIGSGCAVLGFSGMQISHKELWLQSNSVAEPFWYERAREFHCYADLPGVSGGRDMSFERYDDIVLHDKGATHWFTTRGEEKREIGLTLQAITWHILNENNGNFNRNSLVLYASEKMPDGSVKSHPYTFTEPSAKRIGYNLRWMLVNCAIVPRDEAKPEM